MEKNAELVYNNTSNGVTVLPEREIIVDKGIICVPRQYLPESDGGVSF